MAIEPDLRLEAAPQAGGWRRDGRVWVAGAPFYAVVGDPVAHSLSPRLQTAALRARGLPHLYGTIHVRSGELARLKAPGGAPGLAGFNVTAPLKTEAHALCDQLTPAAQRAGAVNAVRVGAGRWEGHNTDVGGIAGVLSRAWGHDRRADVGIVLGSGGAARAAALALLDRGLPRVVIRARSAASVRRCRAWLDDPAAPAPRVTVELLTDADPATAGERTIWVVCLAAGVEAAPYLPRAATGSRSLVLDLRYGPALPAADRPALPWRDGRDVLLEQGALAFAWWFGEPVPREAMRAALA